MAEIKVKPKGTIKKLEKEIVQVQKFKNNLITVKEKINEFSTNDSNNTAEDYASQKIQNDISYISRKGEVKVNEIGKKSLKETQENFIKGKPKVEILKSRIKEKNARELKNVVENSSKAIKKGTKQSIKTAKNTTILAKKGIKTSEQVTKNTKVVAKESVKMTQRAVQISKRTIQATIKATKITIQTTIKTVKAIITTAKAIISAIIAGGWVAVVIILVIALIGGFIAAIFNSNGDADYDTSQIPISEIILVAKAQIGNEGGDKFWKWYGFEEHVHWCACYVSWCANECGYIEKGIIPKFAVCTDGITWFKEINGTIEEKAITLLLEI